MNAWASRRWSFPGFDDGGAEWGGQAADPARGILYLNANDVAWTGGLAGSAAVHSQGARLYQDNCAACHGPDRKGAPPAFPSLADSALIDGQMAEVIHGGRGRMSPGLQLIAGENLMAALLNYVLRGGEDKEMAAAAIGYGCVPRPIASPAIASSWIPTLWLSGGGAAHGQHTFSAIDLNSGTYLVAHSAGRVSRAGRDKSTGSEKLRRPGADRGRGAVHRRHAL